MKLNPDCIRDILLTVEEHSTVGKNVVIVPNQCTEYIRLKKYQPAEIAYHLRQCCLNGLFYNAVADLDCTYTIQDLSPKGHEFLANIRSEKLWKKTLRLSKKIGSAALPILMELAAMAVKDEISNIG